MELNRLESFFRHLGFYQIFYQLVIAKLFSIERVVLTIRIVEQYAVAIVDIQLNGETFNASGPLSISRLLVQLGIDSRRVAVEHNPVRCGDSGLLAVAFDGVEDDPIDACLDRGRDTFSLTKV